LTGATNGSDTSTVTAKVFALLAAFTPAAPELTLSELSRKAGVSLPTAHRRAAELVAWGALERVFDVRSWSGPATKPSSDMVTCHSKNSGRTGQMVTGTRA
jgi:hypothetical protein